MSASTVPPNFEPKTNRIIDQRKGRFFIRESYLNPEDGEVYWLVSTINEKDSQQEFAIKIPERHPKTHDLVKNLDGAIMDLTSLHLVKNEENPNTWMVQDASPTMGQEARVIRRKSKESGTLEPHCEWTPQLGDRVEKYAEYRLFERISEIKKDLYNSPEHMSQVKTMTDGLFLHKVKEVLPDVTDTELKEFLSVTREPDSIHRNESFTDLMKGREIDTEGNVKRVFYHTEYPVSAQITKDAPTQSTLSSIYNYAAQASTVNMIKAMVDQSGPTEGGLLKMYEEQLVEMKALVEKHPSRSNEDYSILTREYAELLAGESIRAQMAGCGAGPSHPDYDDINIEATTELSGRGQDETFGNEICREVMGNFASRKEEPEDPFKEYLKLETKYSYGRAKKAKDAVEVAQDDAMAQGKERNPGFSVPKPVKEMTGKLKDGAADIASKTVDVLDDIGF